MFSIFTDTQSDGHGTCSLRQSKMFHRLLRALIELARQDDYDEERALLESISNHVAARGVAAQAEMPV